MKIFIFYFLVIISTNLTANNSDIAEAGVQINSATLNEIEFKSNENKNLIGMFFKVVLIAGILIVVSIGFLLAVKEYKTKLPLLSNRMKSNIDLIEYKKLPGNLDIYILKIYGEDLIVANNNNNIINIYLKQTDFNENK